MESVCWTSKLVNKIKNKNNIILLNMWFGDTFRIYAILGNIINTYIIKILNVI